MKRKKKNKKKNKVVVLHQHKDATSIFGKAHPVTKKHSKLTTQQAHNRTVELDRG